MKSPVVRSSGYVQGAGARIWFRTAGLGPPLVLLHGGPGADHTDFIPHLTALARRFCLVFVDQRGGGRSERLGDPGGYRLELMVEDLEALRRHLKLEKWNVLGHSFGGILAQAYAVRHPRRVTGLILAGTASSARPLNADFRRIRTQQPARVRARLEALERRGIFTSGAYEPSYAALASEVFGPYMYAGAVPKTPSPPIATDVVRAMWSDRSDFRITGNLKGFDFTQDLRRLRAPVLVVAGDRDLVSPESLELTRRSCQRATLVIVAQCGHMMFVDHTDFFNHLVGAFLDQCGGGARGTKRRAA